MVQGPERGPASEETSASRLQGGGSPRECCSCVSGSGCSLAGPLLGLGPLVAEQKAKKHATARGKRAQEEPRKRSRRLL